MPPPPTVNNDKQMDSTDPEDNPKMAPSNDKESEQATVEYLVQTLKDLQKENETLKRELQKTRRAPTAKLGIALFVAGAAALVGSVLRTQPILAFIGLGLVFWGALFLFSRPIRFVKGTVLDSTVTASYATIDRMTHDLNYKGRPIYVPPYPEEAYLPEHLKGLKEMVVFIPADETITIPTLDEMARKEFLLRNPKGICITPPGYGLTGLIEKELRSDLSQIDKERFCNILPEIIVNNLALARKFEIDTENNLYHVKIIDSVYKDLYSSEQGFNSVHSVGCPLASALASALTKVTGKPVAIAKDSASVDLRTIEVWYQTLEI